MPQRFTQKVETSCVKIDAAKSYDPNISDDMFTKVYERPSSNNKALIEKAAKVNQVEIKKEPMEEMTRCQCVECPELVKNNKIKTLLYTSSTDSNSNFIIELKEILNPVNESPGEYVRRSSIVMQLMKM